MNTATVTPLPGTRLLCVPGLERADRKRELENLAEDVANGIGPSPVLTDVLVRFLAHDSLSGVAASEAFRSWLTQRDRADAAEAGEPDFRDPEPNVARFNADATLRLLLDGGR